MSSKPIKYILLLTSLLLITQNSYQYQRIYDDDDTELRAIEEYLDAQAEYLHEKSNERHRLREKLDETEQLSREIRGKSNEYRAQTKRMMADRVLRDYEELADEIYDEKKKKAGRRRKSRKRLSRKKPVGQVQFSVEGGGTPYCKDRLEKYDHKFCITPTHCFVQERHRVVKDCDIV